MEAYQEVAASQALTLMEKLAGPKNVRSPVSAVVMVDGDRQIVSGASTYIQHQQSRMNSPLYRKLAASDGFRSPASHMESAIKDLQFRMKGSEKSWSKQGGQSVIQLRADNLSETDPLSVFWKERAQNGSGLRRCVGIRKAAALSRTPFASVVI